MKLTALLFGSLLLIACSSQPAGPPPKYPERQPGCEVRVSNDRPSYPTDNIGPVMATCDESVSDSDCMRTLMDQACKLGADTIWGVSDKPELKLGKKHFNGRAAHQK